MGVVVLPGGEGATAALSRVSPPPIPVDAAAAAASATDGADRGRRRVAGVAAERKRGPGVPVAAAGTRAATRAGTPTPAAPGARPAIAAGAGGPPTPRAAAAGTRHGHDAPPRATPRAAPAAVMTVTAVTAAIPGRRRRAWGGGSARQMRRGVATGVRAATRAPPAPGTESGLQRRLDAPPVWRAATAGKRGDRSGGGGRRGGVARVSGAPQAGGAPQGRPNRDRPSM